MSRWLAGVFDPERRGERARLARALAPHEATVLECGPLHVAFSGPDPPLGDLLCLFDGHLDNAAELRRALGDTDRHGEGAQQGHVVVRAGGTHACTEHLLARAYQRWGHGLLTRLRGDFALLIWDRERGEGLLARDQLGVRPVFLHETGGTLCFASEVRHLLALLAHRPPPDPASVAHWISVSTRPGTSTLYSGVRRLRPAGVLLLDGGGAREKRWWTPRFEEPLELPDGELAARTRAALELAVRRRIAPEGHTAVLMSGGLDSSSVAALCAREAPQRTLACSAVFPEHPAANESQLIDALVETLSLSRLGAVVLPGGRSRARWNRSPRGSCHCWDGATSGRYRCCAPPPVAVLSLCSTATAAMSCSARAPTCLRTACAPLLRARRLRWRAGFRGRTRGPRAAKSRACSVRWRWAPCPTACTAHCTDRSLAAKRPRGCFLRRRARWSSPTTRSPGSASTGRAGGHA